MPAGTSADPGRWVGDGRVSAQGSDWRHHQPHLLRHVGATFPDDQREADQRRYADRVPGPRGSGSPAGSDFFDRVLEATCVRYPDAGVTPFPDEGYLRVSRPLPVGGVRWWPVGVVAGEVTDENLRTFVHDVHSQFVSADPSVHSELVYGGRPAGGGLVAEAGRHGVRLRSFLDYQDLLDFRSLVVRQSQRLDTDPIYPAELYVPQRYRLLDDRPDGHVREPLLNQVIEWLDVGSARFVMVLGDFGRGKTFFLRELARALPQRLPGLLPVLVELRRLEKAPSFDELLAQHLVREKVDPVDVRKLQYMIRSGRLALLFDGFDELELRVGYDNAADYLNVLLREVTDSAKVVLTSRTQHFQSTAQVRTALGAEVAARTCSRAAVLEEFTGAQILQFLTKHYGGDADKAQARFALLGDVRDLLGLSRNPRMLSFIADLDERRLRAVREERGHISASELYRELIEYWLLREADRDKHPGGLPSLDEQDRLRACTALALRLWATTASAIPLAEFTAEMRATLTGLADRRYTDDQAAHTVGLGTLLVITPDGEFTFVHESVMEWLVANSAATRLRESTGEESAGSELIADTLVTRRMSALMLEFLCDLAGHEVARRWAEDVVADPMASAVAKQNGLAVTRRLGSGRRQELAGIDLRSEDLTDRDLRNANLRGADLRGMRLTGTNFAGADLRGANFTAARIVGGDLTGALLEGSQWTGAAVLGVAGLESATVPELAAAAVAGRDPADVMIAPTGDVSSAVFSPDGKLLAISRGPCAEIIDVARLHPLRALIGHAGEVTGVAFSPDGALLATASADHSVRVWDPVTGAQLRTLTGHTDWVRAVAFSPDGALLASASADRTVRLWDPATGLQLQTLTGHTNWVTGVAFVPHRALLVSASADHTARVWDLATGQQLQTLTGHTGWVRAVALQPDGRQLATASDDGTIRLWDPATGQHLRTLTGHTGWVTGVAFSPDGAQLATTSTDGTVWLWDPRTTLHLGTMTGYTSPMRGTAFSPDGTLLATASADHTVRLWNPATGQHRRTLIGHAGWVRGVAFSPDGALLASSADDGTARLWDPATGQPATVLAGNTGWVRTVAFSPQGDLLATASEDGTVRLWDPSTGKRHTTLIGHPSAVWGVAFSPDGALLASGSDDHTVRLWGPGLRQFWRRRHRTLTGHTDWVRGVAFSPDGALLASASDDQTIRLWDPETGEHLRTLTGHRGWVRGVAFSPDGALLASASSDGTVRLWNPETGEHLRTLTGHRGWVRGVAFSPDGGLLASGSGDGTTRLWDPETGALLATLLALEASGYAVLLPDGSYKLDGNPGRLLWWAIKLCRLAPGEFASDAPAIQQPADAPIPR